MKVPGENPWTEKLPSVFGPSTSLLSRSKLMRQLPVCRVSARMCTPTVGRLTAVIQQLLPASVQIVPSGRQELSLQ